MLKKIIAHLKNLVSKVFGNSKDVVVNERMQKKIDAGHSNVPK